MDLPPDLTPEAPLSTSAEGCAPYLLTRPARQSAPLVFASPHSGRAYPASFVAAARLDPVALRRSEDGFVDELFAAAAEHGAPLLAATFPRVFCDVNREPWELDPGMFDEPLPSWVNTASPRVGAGLGTIARVVATGEAVYRRKLTFGEAEDRIRRFWQPYHAALAALIAETRDEFGACLLIDCHSMPTHPAQAGNPPDFVLGDAHGTSCALRATRLVEEVLSDMGYRVRRNDPYAGGYVTRHYGRPREGVHALQIEVSRPLYMDEERIERLPRMAALQADLTRLIAALRRTDWSFLR
ncbi:MAG: N-formylglutamate deformylase [uncultured Acetobacteraceae bacterium]|jgi:N-formylglutamate amidohydrolase|uniref:N-formylglutamate deformylase n=1 Tax=uncultured Acetobacteraceae bacterium TaxID=169975 RepID=A0A6J4HWD3_9PROT|nr:MAG: N-formylglutamate deformylase [uncultured Acetobacteraceae bacterium]